MRQSGLALNLVPCRNGSLNFVPIRRLADEPPNGRLRVLRLVQLATAGGVSTGEWSCTEPMGDHAEKHSQTDRTDHLIDRPRYAVQVLQSNERENDRG